MKTYVRPMAGWWRRNPFYLWYMARELSSVFITTYALVLLVGLARLAQGRAAFDAWRESLGGASALLFHVLALLFVVYHAWTWFQVMPKTLPFVRIGSWRLPDRWIVALGTMAGVGGSLMVLVAVRWGAP